MLDVILMEEDVVKKFKKDYELPSELKWTEMVRLLVKYYILKNKEKDEIYKCIMKDIQSSLKDKFIYTKWDSLVKKNINYFTKIVNMYKIEVKLFQIEQINITSNELNNIKRLNNIVLEKIAFILLVYAKISKIQMQSEDCWVNKSITTICKEAKVGLRGIEKARILNELYKIDYISINKVNTNTNIKVCFIDNEFDEKGLMITDFNGVVYHYLNWKGENWIRCEGDYCSKWVKSKSNRTKYCKTCWKEKQLEWQRESMRKLREN